MDEKYYLVENGIITAQLGEETENCWSGTDAVLIGDKIGYYFTQKETKQILQKKPEFLLWSEFPETIPPDWYQGNDGVFYRLPVKELLQKGFITAEEYRLEREPQILEELNEIDSQTTRPLRAILSGYSSDADKEKLSVLEEKARTLRKELQDLSL